MEWPKFIDGVAHIGTVTTNNPNRSDNGSITRIRRGCESFKGNPASIRRPDGTNGAGDSIGRRIRADADVPSLWTYESHLAVQDAPNADSTGHWHPKTPPSGGAGHLSGDSDLSTVGRPGGTNSFGSRVVDGAGPDIDDYERITGDISNRAPDSQFC